jgi:aldose 1-epimerase
MANIEQRSRDDITTFVLTDGSGAAAEVAPELGNNCFAFRSHIDVLEPVSWNEFHKRPTSYGIPVLFPFPNRIRDGEFRFQGKSYKVDPPRHGFVRDRPWSVMETGANNDDGAWLRCRFDAADYPGAILAQFTFPFVLEMTHRLRDGRLSLQLEVSNTGSEDMPAGYGLHPYFRRPLDGSVSVPANRRWELAENLPTGRTLALDPYYDLRQGRDLDGLVLDDIYSGLEGAPQGVAQCMLRDSEAAVETVVELSSLEFPFVVVFTPPAPRRAICIEPNTCPTDAFNLAARGVDANVITLPPG